MTLEVVSIAFKRVVNLLSACIDKSLKYIVWHSEKISKEEREDQCFKLANIQNKTLRVSRLTSSLLQPINSI